MSIQKSVGRYPGERKKFSKPIEQSIKKTSSVIISLTQCQLLVVFRGPLSLTDAGYLYIEIFILIYQVIFKFINLSLYLLGRITCIRLLMKRWKHHPQYQLLVVFRGPISLMTGEL